MRGFVKTILLYTAIVGLGMLAVLLLADGSTDPFYLRFTTQRQAGLIVGTSRPAQALLPARIRTAAGQQDNAPALYNFSFTLVHSPFGPTYLEAIRAKMDHDVRDAVHIVSVEPWSICIDRAQADDPLSYNEQNLCLGTTPSLCMDPNLPYLLKSYRDKFLDIVEHRLQENETFLHDDGWLQINSTLSEAQKDGRRRIMLADFREKARTMRFSTIRFGYLIKTIELLSTTGKVHLVRLPVSRPLLAVEDSLMPGFDALMGSMARSFGVPYINCTDSLERFAYTDGGHVERESAFRISDGLGALIRKEAR